VIRRTLKRRTKSLEATGTCEKIPHEFLTWSSRKQKKYLRELLRSISPGPVTQSSPAKRGS
jgi:hypothetical protein